MNTFNSPSYRQLGPGRSVPVNQSIESWRQSLRDAGFSAPKGVNVHASMLLRPGGDRAAAKVACERFLALGPDHPEVLAALVALLQAEGRADQSSALRRSLISQRVAHWALEESEHTECVDYFFDASSGKQTPARTPDAYVTALFDNDAENFDRHLVDHLDYRGPELILGVLERCGALDANPPQAESRTACMLDLGCGTGLVGSVLRPHARWLEGVDLSGEMIGRARERCIYDSLTQASLLEYLDEGEDRFQLIAAGEVPLYFGDLEPVLLAVRRRLAPGGRFVFTLEQTDGQDFRLRSTGRYQHHHDYAIEVAERTGYDCESFNDIELREHNGVGVPGYLIVLRNPD